MTYCFGWIKTTRLSLVFLFTLIGCACISGPASADWSELASLDVSRSEIAAAVVDQTVFVAGGIGRFGTLKSCEMYNRNSNQWSDCPNLPRPLHHVALASVGKDIYACGGYTSLRFTHDKSAKLWKLDLQQDKWIAVADLPEPIGEHAMLALDGNLYVVGGRTENGDSNTLWQFNVAGEKWRELASMTIPRHSFAAVEADGEIWVLGGRSAALGSAIRQTEIYSPRRDAWRTGPTLPVGRGGHVAVYHEGSVHVIGGEVFDPNQVLDQYHRYDLETKKWYQAPPPAEPRHGLAAVVVDKELLLIGGATRPALATVFSTSSLVQKLSLSSKTRVQD